MKKKVDIRDIAKGMYVSDLDRPWVESPFLFQGFEIKNDSDIVDLQKHCTYVYIDTELGIDFIPQAANRGAANRARELEEKDKQLKREFRRLAEMPLSENKVQAPAYQDRTPLEQELREARAIQTKARDAMREVVENVEKGKKVDVPMAKKVVGSMVDSVVRNPDALVCLSQLKDVSEYTALHSVRSAVLALAFGRHLVFSKEDLATLGMGAMLHDVGMARVPKEILDKPGGLTPDEFAIMQKHIQWGIEILEKSGDVPPLALEFIKQHHERHDGSGYPNKLKGDQIGYVGGIGSIVDVYDAITSDTTYHAALSAEEVLKMMYEWRHKDFNASLVEEFIKCMGIFPIGSLVELSAGGIGVVVTINRSRRLKPKVSLVLNENLKPYGKKIVADLSVHKSTKGEELKIKRVLPAGSLGINPMDHIVLL
ncbi:MAG: HD-GYP domain-containing protein [Gammaproteobacteria bacterium]|nr:HD-GYP domain-containing protein [Gammaproteobacteria bacterium]